MLATLVSWPAPAQTPYTWLRDPVLSRLLVQQMATDAAGLRWVATDEGVYRYDGYETVALGRLVRQGTRLPVEMVSTLAFDGAGRLWLGSATGLYCFQPTSGVLRKVALPPDLHAGVAVHGLLWHPRTNRLWVAHSAELLLLNPAQPERPLVKLLLPADRDPSGVFTVDRASGEAWYSTRGREVYRLGADGTIRQHFLLEEFAIPLVGTQPQRMLTQRALLEATPAGRWRALLHWPGGTEYSFQPWSTDTTMDFITRQYRVHLHRPAGPRPQVRRELLRLGDTPENHPDYQLSQDPEGVWWCYSRLWRGCYKQRPMREVVQAPPFSGGHGPASARAICRLADGRLLVSTYAGVFTQAADSPQAPLRLLPLWECQRGRRTPIKMTFVELRPTADPGRFVMVDEGLGFGTFVPATGEVALLAGINSPSGQALLRDQAGQWWGGGQAGLYHLDLARRLSELYPVQPLAGQLRQLKVFDLAEDRAHHALWLVTNGGLWWYRPADHKMRHFGVEAAAPFTLPTNALLTVLPTGPGRAWLGTRDQGLLEIDLRRGLLRQLSEAQGLPSHTVATLLPGAAGQLWVGTYAGVAQYDPARDQLAVFGAQEGISNTELNRHSAFADADGTLWLGGMGGIYHIRPEQMRPSPVLRQPQLRVTAISQTVRGQRQEVQEMVLPGGRPPSLTLAAEPGAMVGAQLAFTDFFAPDLVRYFYRLRQPAGGALTAWQATPHQLVLRGLAPGRYYLEVRAENQWGQAAGNRLLLPLRVLAAWWQQPLLWVLAASLLVGLGYTLHAARLWWARRDAAMRAELAANLHDEMGALLTRVNLLAEVLREQYAPAHSPTQIDEPSAFDHLLRNSRAAAQAMRDVVWGIDSRADSIGALVTRMQSHLDQSIPLAGLAVQFHVSGLSAQLALPPAIRQHLYLIFKEAVTNALRHAAGATELRIRFEREPTSGLTLEILDNGTAAPRANAEVGMGLRNMRQRTAIIGAALQAGPRTDGPGYRVWVRVPR